MLRKQYNEDELQFHAVISEYLLHCISKRFSALGYNGPNPWHQWANSGRGDDGETLSCWLLQHASEPAAVAEEESKTPYATNHPIKLMEQAKEN